jgi:excisionase family DNA binding protein
MAAAFVSSLSPTPHALFLTLEQAAAYSGLSRALIKRLIKEKKIPAWLDGGYKISRKVLDTLAEWRQEGRAVSGDKKVKR